MSAVDAALGVAWLVVPAVQYLGAYERAGIQAEIGAGKRADLNLQGLEAVAVWDLTPLYAVLIVATVARVTGRWLSGRRPPT